MFYNLGTLLHQILAMALAVNFMLIGRYHPWVTSFISKASVAIEIGGCSDLNLHSIVQDPDQYVKVIG